jgi:hypothetical protein
MSCLYIYFLNSLLHVAGLDNCKIPFFVRDNLDLETNQSFGGLYYALQLFLGHVLISRSYKQDSILLCVAHFHD